MAGKLGEILIIFIMPVEKRFVRIWKNLLQWVITNNNFKKWSISKNDLW